MFWSASPSFLFCQLSFFWLFVFVSSVLFFLRVYSFLISFLFSDRLFFFWANTLYIDKLVRPKIRIWVNKSNRSLIGMGFSGLWCFVEEGGLGLMKCLRLMGGWVLFGVDWRLMVYEEDGYWACLGSVKANSCLMVEWLRGLMLRPKEVFEGLWNQVLEWWSVWRFI